MSTRIFRLLLRIFPAEFRQDYGRQLEQVLREDYQMETLQRGWRGVVRPWWDTAVDLARNAPREHLSDLAPETRYAARSLYRQTGFTSLVVAILALGIGATTAVFSIVQHRRIEAIAFP